MNAKHRLATAALAGAICALALARPIGAATVYVNGMTGNNSWSGLCETQEKLTCGPKLTIQAAIDVAVAGDEVVVADGIYIGAGNKDLDFHGKAITVRSASGDPTACIIDCQMAGRAFYFHSNEGAATVVQAITIRNGLVRPNSPGSYYGAAVYCLSASPTLTNCLISANSATSGNGGGIACRQSSHPTLANCTITGNSAPDSAASGGGMYCESSSPTLTDCVISGNSSRNYGGGIYCDASSPTISRCTIAENTAGYDGAGVFCSHYSSPTLANCTIRGNNGYGGAGLHCEVYCSPALTSCTITGNTAYYAAGLSCQESSNAVLTDCTISGNTASSSSASGGGVYCNSSSPTLTNCTITGNAASAAGPGSSTTHGGGVCCSNSSHPTLTACRISANAASSTASYTQGGGVYSDSSNPLLDNCEINQNSATYGAGIHGPAALTSCTITDNTAAVGGGGVYGTASLTNCTISANTATEYGAGIYGAGSLTDCTITRNRISATSSRAAGAGVYCAGSLTLINCTISGNTASTTSGEARGGGMYALFSYSDTTLANCVISANVAHSDSGTALGAGLSCDSSSKWTLVNCAIAGNTASSGAAAAKGGAVYCNSSSPNLTNSILWADTPQEIYVSSATPVVRYSDVQGGYTGTGNLNVNPQFVNAAAGDYHLGRLSPCIDAGDPTSDFSLEPEPDGGRINMGAYGNTPEAETKGWIYIDSYHIARKTRVGRTIFEYDLTTTLRNASTQGVTNLVATLLAAPSNVQIIDGVVNVGDLPAGATVESTDTFTIRVDRTTLVSPLPISWRVTYSNTFADFTTLLDLGSPRLPGDTNCDGRVDFDDINPFVLALTGADGYYSEYPECDRLNADCNEDGSVDFDDINPFVELLTQ